MKERFLYDAFGKPMFLAPNFSALADPETSPIDWEHLSGTLRYDRATGLYFDGAGYHHPRLGRSLPTGPIGNVSESRLNSYVAGFPVTAPPPAPGSSLEEFNRIWSELTPYEQSGLIKGGVGIGIAVVGLTIVSGGSAVPALGSLAAAGAVVGGVHGGLETYAANPDAGALEYGAGIGLGATFGWFYPPGAFVSATGAVVGGLTEKAYGGDFLGTGFQVGGLIGGVAGGFSFSAARSALRQGAGLATRRAAIVAAASAGSRNLRWEASGIIVGAGFGLGIGRYHNGEFRLRDAYHGATWGMFAGGIAHGVNDLGIVNIRAFTHKRFYRGTTYYAALETVQDQAVSLRHIATGQAAAAYDFGEGLYLTKSARWAYYYAELAQARRSAGGEAVLQIEISRFRWWRLRQRFGALEDQPTSRIPDLQSFVPTDGLEYFIRFASYELLPLD